MQPNQNQNQSLLPNLPPMDQWWIKYEANLLGVREGLVYNQACIIPDHYLHTGRAVVRVMDVSIDQQIPIIDEQGLSAILVHVSMKETPQQWVNYCSGGFSLVCHL